MLNAVAIALLLTGVVRTSDGQPVAGARVIVHQASAAIVVTDASGRFRVPDVTLPVDLTVQVNGFAERRVTVFASPVDLTVLPESVSASVLVLGSAGGRDLATGAVTFDKTFLSNSPGLTVDEVLRPSAGLSLFRRSSARTANPTTHGVTMRGLSASGASRALVLFDGLPLNDGFGAWVTWTRVPTEAIDSIEVLPGAGGDLFGSDALGGVIRIRSTMPHRAGPSLSLAVGTRETKTGDVSGGATIGRTAMWLAASAVDTAGEFRLEPISRGLVDRPASANWWNAFGRVDVTAGPRRWTLTALGGRDRRGNGTVLQRNRSAGGTALAAVQSVSGTATWAARVAVSPNRYQQTFSAVSSSRATEFLVLTQFIDVTTTRAVVEYGRTVPLGFVMVRAGATRAAADFEQRRTSETTTVALRDDSESLSVQAAVSPGGSVTIGGGVRHEWRAAPTSADGRDRATIGRLSASWQVRPSVVVRTAAATSHRWPTLNEMTRGFRVGSTSTLANPSLKPERAGMVDAGVTWSGLAWTGGLAAFQTTVDDVIANVTLPSLTGIVRERQNAGQARARGVEVDLDGRPASWLQVRGSVILTDSTFQHSAEPAIEGNRLPQVPRVSAALAFNLRPASGWRVDVVARSIGAQFDDDRNAFELAPAHQVDGRIAARTSRIEWAAVVENVFGARVEVGRTPLVTLAPGRAMRLSATWR